MARHTFPVPPTANPGTFAAGWNARCTGLEFRHHETDDWKIGWRDADAVPDGGRRPYNDTAPISWARESARAA